MLKTALFEKHQQAGARLVEFAGWEMPLNYGSQIEEHNQVRNASGLFDVSHMMVTDFQGKEAHAFLRKLLANDVSKLKTTGQALYSCMLNENGGVIDDLIVYFRQQNNYRIVSNAGTRQKVSDWFKRVSVDFEVEITTQNELAIIAVQGPETRGILCEVLAQCADQLLMLSAFNAFQWHDLFIACTGYTGEDGFEIILPAEQSADFWQQLIDVGIKPIGLGARDSLRLEAGMNLYGSDMDEEISPLQAGLSWTVALQDETRNFIGRAALQAEKSNGISRQQIGLLLNEKGVLRAHQELFIADQLIGEITSGGFSPVLGQAIALARVDAHIDTKQLADIEVEIRNKRQAVEVTKPPFI